MKPNGSLMNDFFSLITPDYSFSENRTPSAPDYGKKQFWAAIPGKKSVALLDPEKVVSNELKETDCFFIHPTGFFLKEWNFNLDQNSATSQRTDLMLATQASVFSENCNIYAPEYRQATFAAISQNLGKDSVNALEIAYQDIKAAFKLFLDLYSNERPFFIASHSQGALHAQRLISEKIFKEALSTRLISAYLVGYPLEEEYIQKIGIDISEKFLDEGRLIQFQTIGQGGKRPRLKYWMFDGDKYALKKVKKLNTTNPISMNTARRWEKNEITSFLMPKISGISPLFDYAARLKNESYVRKINFAENQNFSAKIDAQGYLETKGSAIDRILKNDFTGMKDLHIWDYQIFWKHLKIDVENKIKSLN
ncbi:MAG: DUF3089 domain-containing protein [Gammaproteobacteria bacterium TMED112]|nr:MAG: DUF3089 domain-containing protein [Gammaproteobacteria bacterium TMED112]|tara:strand:+ start:2837 stop:3931 length:1095 start_codon:yes stop_codon:yes gene_type:complete